VNILDTPTATAWKKIGIHPHHGLNIFLTSIHTEESCGIGEYLDLIPVINYCKDIGFDIIQLLPINDSGQDPSPYNAISSIALNPIYLSLKALPHLEQFPLLVEKLKAFKAYNLLPRVAFRDVLIAKLQWLKEYFLTARPYFAQDQEFHLFKAKNSWVETYAIFKVLKDRYDHRSWETWPKEFQSLSPQRRIELVKEFEEEIEFYTVLQYLCFEQLHRVRAHADKIHLFLKGDIPILVSRDSVDVWNTPQFFDLRFVAGAPPDMYCTDGQYWGFPLFDWDAMRKTDYLFWKERLRYADSFFHIFRIDHILGFYRIWSIPFEEAPKFGTFLPKDPEEWVSHGEHLLKMIIASSNMLPVGEDLGILTKEIRASLANLGIPGTKVIRWQRNYDNNKEFIPYDQYPMNSMTCISTHDSETLTQWWQSEAEDVKLFATFNSWTYTPILDNEKRFAILKHSHKSSSLLHINLIQEYFALFPELIAEDPNDERINIPGKLLLTNWTYRYRTPIEVWSQHGPLQKVFKELIA
jgi:4-alpha-glucanotransferase